MPVNTTHPMYDKFKMQWKRCRDAAAGQCAVHEAGVEYLPKLKNQTDEDYQAYKKRAGFFNATWRTIVGLKGMIMRLPPQVVLPSSVEPMMETVTSGGQSLLVFTGEVVEDCLTVGRVGVLVDYPVVPEGLTLADASAMRLQPTLCKYRAESILNWKTMVMGNQRVLSMVVLEEEAADEKNDDEFDMKCKKQWRVLDLFEGKYRVRLFELEDKNYGSESFVQVGEDIFPQMGNQPMSFVPFYFMSVDDTEPDPDAPPLIDLVDMNLSHYQTNADYEHGCHFTGLPTGYICGYRNPDEAIYLGSQTMLQFEQPDTKVGFLEFSGAGLQSLERNMENKKQQMAILGARMLEEQKRAAEAAETARIHRTGEQSVLADMAATISMGIQSALATFCLMAGADDGEVSFTLNSDFFPIPIDAPTMLALVQAWQQGAISKETLFINLQQGEVVPQSADFETEEAKIANTMNLTSAA